METMKEMLLQSGAPEEAIATIQEKYDLEKVGAIIDSAHNPQEAFAAIHNLYPDVEISALESQMDFIQEQIEAASKEMQKNETLELNEEELESIVGGSWYSDNWRKLAKTAAFGALGVVVGASAGALLGGQFSLAGLAVGAIVGAAAGGYIAGKYMWDYQTKKEQKDANSGNSN